MVRECDKCENVKIPARIYSIADVVDMKFGNILQYRSLSLGKREGEIGFIV